MAQALSEEEFHRMQAQLLELRTQNYQLSDDLRKNTAELTNVRQKTLTLEKDYLKAQKALNKSKKAQEVDALLSENEMLQGKLHSQEDDFRLQNSTLMQELSKLCSQIEQLETENQGLREGRGLQVDAPSPVSGPTDGELLRLQAENSALQKKLAALQDSEQIRLRGLDVSDGKEVAIEGQADANGLDQLHADAARSGDDATAASASDRSEQVKIVSLEQKVNELSEVELKLQTELEEKRLLKVQLQALETSKQAELVKLLEENAKLMDKLKKKQESFLQLQGEKEALYHDSRTKIDEIQQRKEEELRSINLRVQKLQSDLINANQNVAELKEQLQSKQKEHEVALLALKDQVACQSAVSQEQVEGMLTENDALRTNLAALEQIQTVKTQEMNLLREQNMALNVELQQRRSEQESFLAQKDDLSSQLQESNRASSRLLEQISELGLEKDKLQQDLEEAKKTADKRKAMLDELAIETAQEKSRHKEELSDVRLQHEKEVLSIRARYEKELRGLHEEKSRAEEEIRAQLRDEKARNKELEGLQQIVDDLQAQVQSMEGTKGWFERRLKEAEETLEKNRLEHTGEIEKLQREQALQLKEKSRELEALMQQITAMDKEREDFNNTVTKLKQEIRDTVDEQRILEKKGSSALKDLKRQLHLERKRADKLQERLQEILTNSKTRTGLEELVLSEISSPSRTQQTGDSSSVSSFSYREMMKEGASAQTTNKSNTGSPQSQRPADLSDDEVNELFQRLAEVQQEKWLLEEKVKHLEVSCSSMADDICKKSAIIETYVMDSRRDGGAATSHAGHQGERGGLGSVLRDLVKPGDENLREMNKKLQNMLEEQLTKNMHLQKDLEMLSQEIVRLSKGTDPDPKTTALTSHYQILHPPQHPASTTTSGVHHDITHPPQHPVSTTKSCIHHQVLHPPQPPTSTTKSCIHHQVLHPPQPPTSTTKSCIHHNIRHLPQRPASTTISHIHHNIQYPPPSPASTTTSGIYHNVRRPPRYHTSTTTSSIHHNIHYPPPNPASTTTSGIYHNVRRPPRYHTSTTTSSIHHQVLHPSPSPASTTASHIHHQVLHPPQHPTSTTTSGVHQDITHPPQHPVSTTTSSVHHQVLHPPSSPASTTTSSCF
ncbi:GRIP1-associated protein 1 [Silurus meridionalis]|nr:GRIP1-associated protein 1 [Silurus meridionalis]